MRALTATTVMRLILAVAVVACGQSNPDPSASADAAPPDGEPQADVNALGLDCANDSACPEQHGCVFLNAGNPALGYCSPVCLSDADCLANYTGPATGGPNCFVPDQPERCSITCGSDDDCPANLTCIITGGPVNICATR